MIDRSSESTTPIYEQERLLGEVRGLLSDRQVLLVSSKVDITEEENSADDHRISSVTGHGLDDLRSDLIEIIDADRVEEPLKLPENWPREDETREDFDLDVP